MIRGHAQAGDLTFIATAAPAELAQILAECLAYSDSINDLPLLELVGQPQVVNPDRRLRQVADARGWPVREVRSVRTKNRRRRPTAA